MKSKQVILRKIKRAILFFIVSLVISGLTAIPIKFGISILIDILNLLPFDLKLIHWVKEVQIGVIKSYRIAPFLAYGTDWLAFAHFVIAISFMGVYKNPVRNKWTIQFGLITCVLILPMALIAGYFRHIPIIWRLIDCSFGLFGFIILYYCLRLTLKLENIKREI